jgi:phosphoglucomutase
VDPLGGAGVHYWGPIAERYGLDLTVISEVVDPTFRFMTVDWDGQIRMDPSSPYAMARMLAIKDQFDLAFACDTDHDRHGIVTRQAGLLLPNHYLALMANYLFQNRPLWSANKTVGKTVVSSQMINWVTQSLGKTIYEVPVGFKWFVNGLIDGTLGFCGEESAGATCLQRDGSVWTTDKDGIVPALLSAEITATAHRDLSEVYAGLEQKFGKTYYRLNDVKASVEQKTIIKNLTAAQIVSKEVAGDKIETILTQAPGNSAPIGGLKVITAKGWFALRPSGTEAIYKIYAESYVSEDHLNRMLTEAQQIVDTALAQTPLTAK